MSNKKERILTDAVQEPRPKLWSNCLRVGDTIYISGLTSRAADGTTILGTDEYEQSRVIYSKMKAYVDAAGARMDDIVQMVIYLTDISKNTLVWRAREEFFKGDYPTCALVEVSGLAQPEILVEISATAIAGCSPESTNAD